MGEFKVLKSRKVIRLQHFDYSKDGAYFITICADKHKCIFGKFINVCRDAPCGCPQMKLSKLGTIAQQKINEIEDRYGVKVTKYIIMPNHIHLIIKIDKFLENMDISLGHPQGASLQQIVGAYKSLVSVEWLKFCKANDMHTNKIWQRSFYEYVIRDEKSYLQIYKYIDENPSKWQDDEYFIGDEND
ncbi:MAG: transposase [Alphaproteobacteria bacterium]